MLYMVGKNKQIQQVVQPVSLPSLGVLERQHFEEWVCEYPEMLGEELLVITSEFSKFDKTNERLDVLAVDRQGKLVVVELKRDDSGGPVELQAIRYAAYCSSLAMEDVAGLRHEFASSRSGEGSLEDAEQDIRDFIRSEEFDDFDDSPRIIIASGAFREDTLASVLWLRDNGLDITCVRIEAFELGNDIAVRPTVIVPLPEAHDFVVRAEKKKASKEITARQREYMTFYGRMLNRFRERFPDITKQQSSKHSNVYIPCGYGRVHYEWAFHGMPRDSFAVELHFENDEYSENKSLIDFMELHRDDLESRIPFELEFQTQWGRRWARICTSRLSGDADEANLDWGLAAMEAFVRAFQPLLDEYFSK